jgi:hypothetical protein
MELFWKIAKSAERNGGVAFVSEIVEWNEQTKAALTEMQKAWLVGETFKRDGEHCVMLRVVGRHVAKTRGKR